MPDRPRPVVRALVLDESDRVLLVRFEFTDVSLWATPGGGVDPGEDEETALRREMAEETGLRDFDIGPLVWIRDHEFTLEGRYYRQYERIYQVRTEAFDPDPEQTWDELNTEGMTDIRWWTVEEMHSADTVFGSARMPKLVLSLIEEGPPAHPLKTGI